MNITDRSRNCSSETMGAILAPYKDQAQVPLTSDQHPVQALTACAGNPAFRDRVRPRRPDRLCMPKTYATR